MAVVKWGLIGCGDIAQKRVAPALRDLDQVDFVGVSRARFELAEPFAKQFSARKVYRSWQDLLADDEIDAVYIATPVHLHAEQTIAAAEAGKQVLCEKPMALNLDDCDRMIAACETQQVTLGVAYYRHFYPVIDAIKGIIASDEVGRIVMAQLNAFEWSDPQLGAPRDWFIRQDLSGGGPMMDFGCHRIEVLQNILGPATARGVLTNAIFEREVEDTGTACLQFEGGALGIISVTHGALESQDTLDLYGSRGSIHVPVLNEGAVTIKTADGERVERHPPHHNFHQPLIDDFNRAILENREPQADGRRGREVSRLLEQIYRD